MFRSRGARHGCITSHMSYGRYVRDGSLPNPPRLGWMLSSTSVISSREFGEASAECVSDERSNAVGAVRAAVNLDNFGREDPGKSLPAASITPLPPGS